MPPKSTLWKHFDKNSDKTCRQCGKILKTSGNTSNLKCHMESKHENLLGKPMRVCVSEPEAGPSTSLTGSEIVSDGRESMKKCQSTIASAFRRSSLLKKGAVPAKKSLKQ